MGNSNSFHIPHIALTARNILLRTRMYCLDEARVSGGFQQKDRENGEGT